VRTILLVVLLRQARRRIQLGRGFTPIRFFRGFGSVPSDPRLSQNIGMLGFWNLVKIRKIEKLRRNPSTAEFRHAPNMFWYGGNGGW
jgi:hypothetical protein